MTQEPFAIGQKVYKHTGYKYPGIIVSVFTTTAGKERYVVECTAADCSGMLHIFNREQLLPARTPPNSDE